MYTKAGYTSNRWDEREPLALSRALTMFWSLNNAKFDGADKHGTDTPSYKGASKNVFKKASGQWVLELC